MIFFSLVQYIYRYVRKTQHARFSNAMEHGSCFSEPPPQVWAPPTEKQKRGLRQLLGDALVDSLRPYQLNGVLWLLTTSVLQSRHKENGEGRYLADEMGLGKTLQIVCASWVRLLQIRRNAGVSTMRKDDADFATATTTTEPSDTAPAESATKPLTKALNHYILVVCPAHLKENWRREFGGWLRELYSVRSIVWPPSNVKEKARREFPDETSQTLRLCRYFILLASTADIVICSYHAIGAYAKDVFVRVRDAVVPAVMVCDEAHAVKNAESLRAKGAMTLACHARYRFLLSGTPYTNCIVDLWHQMRVVTAGVPELWPSFGAFMKRFCGSDKTPLYTGRGRPVRWVWNQRSKRMTNTKQLQELLGLQCLLMGRKKDAVLKDLPERIRNVLWIDFNETTYDREIAEQIYLRKCRIRAKRKDEPFDESKVKFTWTKRKLLDRAHRAYNVFKEKVSAISQHSVSATESAELSLQIEGACSRARSMTAELKGACLATLLNVSWNEAQQHQRRKIIYFGYHMAVLDAAESWASEYCTSARNTNYIRIDGSTSSKRKSALVDKFQTDPHCRIAILSIGAMCTGVTLTSCSWVVFLELDWTPAVVDQAECRVHRIGQTALNVHYQYLLAPDTIDEQMANTLQRKRRLFERFERQ